MPVNRREAPFPHLDGVQHLFVEIPGLRMHVAEAGHGEPVLLLHGFPQHWWEWREVIPELAAQHRVICPDLRGAGWTDAPATGYTRDQLLADVVALLDALELDRVHLVSHDWGALLGFQLSLTHPDRVRRHVAMSVPHPYSRFQPKLVTTMPQARYQLAIVLPVLGPLAEPRAAAEVPLLSLLVRPVDLVGRGHRAVPGAVARSRRCPSRRRALPQFHPA